MKQSMIVSELKGGDVRLIDYSDDITTAWILNFAAVNNLAEGTVRGQLWKGYCAWPRRNYKDSRRRHPLWRTYNGIKERCYSQSCPTYKYYGERGIKMSTEWFNSFEQFVEDMGPKPSSSYSIDRVDNEGPYAAENCRWASRQVQRANRRNTYRPNQNNQTGRRWVIPYKGTRFKARRVIDGKVYTKVFNDAEGAHSWACNLTGESDD